ncbi:unnamed protein product [Gulo gulo]|uniref:Uncharacterized protein n=1 Tax=Gulo gulo TaxID=48420 RepID=A0A9X9MC82_GULGU|nr:unnamed protein product [Gulo gulo]
MLSCLLAIFFKCTSALAHTFKILKIFLSIASTI